MAQTKFSSLMFLKADEAFKRLAPNERIGLKQKLETLVAQKQDDLFLRIYTLNGLNKDADMLLWLVSSDLDKIHNTWTMFATSGAGQYLNVAYTYLSVLDLGAQTPEEETIEISSKMIGRFKYLNIEPLTFGRSWYKLPENKKQSFIAERGQIISNYPHMSESFLVSSATTSHDYIAMREADSLENLIDAHSKLKQNEFYDYVKDTDPLYFCIGQDLSSVLDSLA